MKNLLTSFILLFVASHTFAATPSECLRYLAGRENPKVIRFGGSKPSTPIQEMANLLLAHVPAEEGAQVQVAIPVNLEHNLDQNQFGDGQRNGFANFGPLAKSPFVAVLVRGQNSILGVTLSKDLPAYEQIKAIEVSILGESRKISLDANGAVTFAVDPQSLGWNQLSNSSPVFFRPEGWSDWFAVQFPNPYLEIGSLLAGMSPKAQVLPDGTSVVDPLHLSGSTHMQDDLRSNPLGDKLGFKLARIEKTERVHGIYINKNGEQILTSAGGVWTRYRDDSPFKIVYLVMDPRDIEAEQREGVVSGTGPHFIGANGEVILNTLGNESLMTFYGVPAPSFGPDGRPLAWSLSHQWVGTWLQPGHVFVTPNGMDHWHPNHLTVPVGAQVFTPPEVPNLSNHYGFQKK